MRTEPVPRHEQSELMRLLALLSGMRLPLQMLAEALRREHMIQDLLSESSFAGAVYDVGKVEGKTEGTTEGKRKLIRLTFEARFGSLSADVGQALAAASETSLESMATGLATESLDQIRARLGLS